MIITQLSITNFGVYQGLHEFDLRPRLNGEQAPTVILIAGKNGSGKTTILEAVRLCLFGRLALGSRVRKTDYDTYIKQRFHRGLDDHQPTQTARVGIVFEHVHAGEKNLYDAVRSWTYDGQKLDEQVSIYKNGQILRDILKDYWNDFLRDLIPPGVADLFFFDGEQIQALADKDTEEVALETAIGGLLNLDLIERLQSDLNIYIRQRNKDGQGALAQDFEAISSEYEHYKQSIQEKRQDRAGLQARLDHTNKLLEEARQKLLSEGAQFIEQHSDLERREAAVKEELGRTRDLIHHLASELLPFSFAPAWNQKLQARLLAEAERTKRQVTEAFRIQASQQISQLLKGRVAKQLADADWQMLLADVEAIFRTDDGQGDAPIVHQVSDIQRRRLLDQIQKAQFQTPAALTALIDQLEALETERSDIALKLKQVPTAEIGQPLIENFQALSEKLGGLYERMSQIDKEIGKLQYRLDEAARKRSRIWHKIADLGAKDMQVDAAAKIQVVLEQYLERVTALKINQLEQQVVEFFNLLCRKEMLVKEVKIDTQQYSVKLYGENRTELPKSSLSAGERQLYAMSLLWALRSVSGRRLPIIIDTPMGRLDSDHRDRLLNHFFPSAAHQIIMLSTDTETTPETLVRLEPAISHVYRLDFDQKTGQTQVAPVCFLATKMDQSDADPITEVAG